MPHQRPAADQRQARGPPDAVPGRQRLGGRADHRLLVAPVVGVGRHHADSLALLVVVRLVGPGVGPRYAGAIGQPTVGHGGDLHAVPLGEVRRVRGQGLPHPRLAGDPHRPRRRARHHRCGDHRQEPPARRAHRARGSAGLRQLERDHHHVLRGRLDLDFPEVAPLAHRLRPGHLAAPHLHAVVPELRCIGRYLVAERNPEAERRLPVVLRRQALEARRQDGARHRRRRAVVQLPGVLLLGAD